MRGTRRALVGMVLLAVLVVPRGIAHSVTDSEWAVRQWAAAYGLSGDYLWGVALCESSGDPNAYNPDGGASGLMQMKSQTFYWLRTQLNLDPTLAPHLTAFDPEYRGMTDDDGAAEAHIAAWAFAHGWSYLWTCA